jgi:uncharacterized membrane protein
VSERLPIDAAMGLAARHPVPPSLRLLLWSGVVVLVALGLAAAIGRGAFLADFATRAEPLREELLRSLQRSDPRALHRAAELQAFDSRFAAHPLTTLLHVLPGALFLILAPLQFSSRVRNRHLRFHRWSGRVLLLAGTAVSLTALYFGLLMPFGGPAEAAAVVVFGGLFLAAIGRAFGAIRRREVARHREWMIRAFAVAIGVSTIRVVGAALDVALAPAGVAAADVFALSLWTGWLISVAGAELWIRYTRPRVTLTPRDW